ncbi:hypothetical protein GX51_04138 [Blastomyces parvus]|uniref:Uncharacterized protein n=1 Tax=Blastomyces parvus TaxID=2060905 RepID=A0A2B7X3K9_9EURO|nr:hypothetical protein GX51_04138 [Blastomyces parvus]
MESKWNTLPHEIQALILSKVLPTFCEDFCQSVEGTNRYLLVCQLWNVEIGRLLVQYHSAECLINCSTESIALKAVQGQIARGQPTDKDDGCVDSAVDSKAEFIDGLHHLLQAAVVRGYMSCIKVLLENGAHQRGNRPGIRILYHLAVSSRNPNRAEMLRLLDAHHVDGLDATDQYGTSPLGLAIISNDLISVEQLILLGAQVSRTIILGPQRGPFAYTVASNNITMMKLLLASGEDPAAEYEYESAFFCNLSTLGLALSNNYEGMIQLLLDSGLPVNTPERPIQPLAAAVPLCSLDRIKDLIDRGAKVNYPDFDQGTPLSRAVRCRDLPIIQLLLDHGAEITLVVCEEALQRYCPHVATLLLKHLVRKERTRMNCALGRNKQLVWLPPSSPDVKDAVEMLLKAGADQGVLGNIQQLHDDAI